MTDRPGFPDRSLHVLYIEDEAALAEMYTILLGPAGYRVSLARDGESGLQAAFDLDPDLVLLDVRLPKLDGISVLEQLRRRLYRGHVWILSNYSERGLQLQAEADGAARWLVKARTGPGLLRQLIDEWGRSLQIDPDADAHLVDLRGRKVEDLEDAVLIADDGGAYVAASDRALELLGYDRPELLGRHIWDIAPDWEVPLAQQSFEAFKHHGAQTGEFVLKTKLGALITIDYDAYAQIRRGLHMSILKPRLEFAG